MSINFLLDFETNPESSSLEQHKKRYHDDNPTPPPPPPPLHHEINSEDRNSRAIGARLHCLRRYVSIYSIWPSKSHVFRGYRCITSPLRRDVVQKLTTNRTKETPQQQGSRPKRNQSQDDLSRTQPRYRQQQNPATISSGLSAIPQTAQQRQEMSRLQGEGVRFNYLRGSYQRHW